MKMQANIVSSILNNGELLQQVYNESLKSAGSAMQEQERWSESLEAHAGRIEAVFESISAKVMDSESLKSIYSGLANILDIIDKIVGNGKGLQLLIGSLGGVLGGSGNGFINLNTIGGFWKEAFIHISNYNKTIAGSAELQREYALSVQSTNAGLSNYLLNLNGANASLPGYIANTITATVKTTAFRIGITALNAAINGLIFAGIGALISWFGKAINSYDDLIDKFNESSDKINNHIDDLEDYRKKIDEVIDSNKSESEKLKELDGIKEEIHKKYQTEIQDLQDVKQARDALNDAIDIETKNQLNDYVNNTENQKAYEESKRRLNDAFVNYSAPKDLGLFDFGAWKQYFLANVEELKDEFNGVAKNTIGEFSFLDTDGNDLKISEDISKLFDTSFEGVVSGKNAFTFGLDYNGDEEAYFKKLTALYQEFSDLRMSRVDGLTEDEEKLFQMVNYQYQRLNEENNGFIQNMKTMAENTAKLLTIVHEQGNMSNEDYFNYVSQFTQDQYVIDALKELIFQNKELAESEEQIVSPLAEVFANLSKVAEETKKVKEEIKTADEQFEKLAKTIDTNKDVDKFFSASDIIEILELYPSLNDAILETAYGYKIEEDALESLRASKLEEKKTALQAQLDEAQGVLDATKAKLNAYKQDLKGVQDVAQAKVRLAELEAKLAQLGSNTTNPYYNNGSLEKQIAEYKDYIDASETFEKQQEEVDKLSIELKVLGNVFDDVKDSTSDQTNELNKQKDAISELKKEYDDAKDAIEDLIKLTMDMIKKEKSLQRDALKEQLDNFKKLIEKKKQLISLEKDQYEFEKDLKKQNRDLLEIQQELDALSVAGAEYSLEDLKRKEELQKQYIEQSEKRDDFLYDHEVETRTKALEDEETAFEDQINTQIKEIENYLQYEGKIRSDAIDLINGKSQEFYNNLLDYTMNYTDKSRYEFDKLWTDAYNAILKFAGGELDADLALMNLIASMKVAENQLKNIESQIDNIKHATDDAKKAMYEYGQVVSDTHSKFKQLYDSPIGVGLPNSPMYTESQKFMKMNNVLNGSTSLSDLMKYIRGYHTGGIVEGVSTKHGEVLAKLLSGEVVATEGQAQNFIEKTLPRLTSSSVVNNNAAPVFNMGDIVINGNADQGVVDKLRAIQKDIANDVFKTINNQKNIFNGGKIRTV